MKGKFFMKNKINGNLFSSILYLLIGVLLIAFPGDMIGWAMTCAGIFFAISGILEMLKKNYAGGAVSLFIGIVILVLGWLVADIVLLVLGILIAVKGVVALLDALKRKKLNVIEIVYAAITIAAGLFLAFGNGVGVLVIIVGVLLAVNGVVGLVSAFNK